MMNPLYNQVKSQEIKCIKRRLNHLVSHKSCLLITVMIYALDIIPTSYGYQDQKNSGQQLQSKNGDHSTDAFSRQLVHSDITSVLHVDWNSVTSRCFIKSYEEFFSAPSCYRMSEEDAIPHVFVCESGTHDIYVMANDNINRVYHLKNDGTEVCMLDVSQAVLDFKHTDLATPPYNYNDFSYLNVSIVTVLDEPASTCIIIKDTPLDHSYTFLPDGVCTAAQGYESCLTSGPSYSLLYHDMINLVTYFYDVSPFIPSRFPFPDYCSEGFHKGYMQMWYRTPVLSTTSTASISPTPSSSLTPAASMSSTTSYSQNPINPVIILNYTIVSATPSSCEDINNCECSISIHVPDYGVIYYGIYGTNTSVNPITVLYPGINQMYTTVDLYYPYGCGPDIFLNAVTLILNGYTRSKSYSSSPSYSSSLTSAKSPSPTISPSSSPYDTILVNYQFQLDLGYFDTCKFTFFINDNPFDTAYWDRTTGNFHTSIIYPVNNLEYLSSDFSASCFIEPQEGTAVFTIYSNKDQAPTSTLTSSPFYSAMASHQTRSPARLKSSKRMNCC